MPSRGTATEDDPLSQITAPPPDETAEQRAVRLQSEEEARRVSQAIDESIKQERSHARKRRIVKLLLLGQSESGKSTTLRQFQRLYTPNAFREERILWRCVIQLNLVRSVLKILGVLHSYTHIRTHADGGVTSGGEGDSDMDEMIQQRHSLHLQQQRVTHGNISIAGLHELSMRLLPLRHIEQLLIAKLVPPNEDEATVYGRFGGIGTDASSVHSHSNTVGQEIFVRPGASWKGFMARVAKNTDDGSGGVLSDMIEGSSSGFSSGLEMADEPTMVLHECRGALMELWRDARVREILRQRKVRLEEQPGFFLNDLERVTSLKYMPSEDDVLKARLKTVGVSEYKFEMETAAGREAGPEWRIIDVGGSRSQVTIWVPFFDDVHAIIFLAPISGFDQVLVEDKTVNRLEDSVLLWKMICSNKLLSNVELVLFLNKCDILDRKLKSGTRLAKYVRSYHDRPNESESIQKYFRTKFAAIQREFSPIPRKFYGFCTSVTDVTTTSGILASIRDMVVREHLKRTRLL